MDFQIAAFVSLVMLLYYAQMLNVRSEVVFVLEEAVQNVEGAPRRPHVFQENKHITNYQLPVWHVAAVCCKWHASLWHVACGVGLRLRLRLRLRLIEIESVEIETEVEVEV